MFDRNKANASGGAIMIAKGGLLTYNRYAEFKNNEAGVGGGAIYAQEGGINFNNEVLFDANIAGTSGGALNLLNSQATFNGVAVFSNNKAGSAPGMYEGGGAITAAGSGSGQKSILKFNGSRTEFNDNTNADSGGALVLGGNTETDFESEAIFLKNRTTSADQGGGAIAIHRDNNILSFMKTVSFQENSSTFEGGAMWITSENSTIKFAAQAAFNFNTAAKSGGGISIQAGNIIFEKEAVIESNSASLNGGGIFFEKAGSAEFKGNTFILRNTADNGGGMYLDNSSAKLNNASIKSNAAMQDGGGFYIKDGGEIEIDGYALIEDNIAAGNGGAVYMKGTTGLGENAVFTINQKSETATNFENNTANGNKQSIYMAGRSILTFNIDENRAVYLRDGLTASGDYNSIDKYGKGTFCLSGDMSNSNANLAVHDGIFKIEAGGKFAAGDVDIKTGAVFDIENGEADKIESKSFHAQGMLKIDVFADGTSDSIEAEEEINIDGGISVLAGVGDYTNKRYAIAHAGAGVVGYFDPEEMHLPVNITHFFDYSDSDWVYLVLNGVSVSDFSSLSPLSFNQKNIARVLDTISPAANAEQAAVIDHMNLLSEKHQKEALSQIAGYFLANVIKSQAGARERRSLYQNIEKRYAQEDNSNANLIWAEVAGGERNYSGDKNSISDFADKTAGVNFGWDNKNESMDLVYGAFGKYGSHDINQKGGNNAEVDSFGAGVYGGHQTVVGIDIKAAVGISGQRYDTVRKIEFMNETAKATFNGMAVNADIEMGYKMEMSGSGINLRPFAGFEKGWVSNEEFKETGAGVLNLKVKNAKYKQSILRAGVGADGKLLEDQKLSWNAGLEYGHIIDGEVSEIETVVFGSGEIASIRGSETGTSVGSINVGADYSFSESIKAYCGIMYATADSYNNYYGNAGIKVAF